MIAEKLDRESFAEGLKLHRDRLGLTQLEAAQECRVSLRVWSKWEAAAGDTLYPTMRGVLDILRSVRPKEKAPR